MFCPSCGAKTFLEDGEFDYDAGDRYACSSCGVRYYMTETEPLEITAAEYKSVSYSPVYSMTERMFTAAFSSMAVSFLERTPIVSLLDEEKEKETTVKFRRYTSIPASLNSAFDEATEQGDNYDD